MRKCVCFLVVIALMISAIGTCVQAKERACFKNKCDDDLHELVDDVGSPGWNAAMIISEDKRLVKDTPFIDDALEILKYVAIMRGLALGGTTDFNTVIADKYGVISCDKAFNAAMVVSTDGPTIDDVLEILKWLASLESRILEGIWGKF